MSDLLEADLPFEKFIYENFPITPEEQLKQARETRLETLDLVRQALGDEFIIFEEPLDDVYLQNLNKSSLMFSPIKFPEFLDAVEKEHVEHEDLLEHKKKSPFYEKELKEIRFFKKALEQNKKNVAKSVKRCYNAKEKLKENNSPELF